MKLRGHWDRRELLRDLGLTGAAFLLPSLRGGAARAAEKPPARVVIFYTFQGWYYPECLPVGAAGTPDSATETNWKWTGTHTPLEPWKAKLLVPNGINVPRGAGKEAHGNGEITALTGAAGGVNGLPSEVSFDQWLATKINTPKPVTALRSLDLRVVSRARGFSNPGIGNMSFASAVASGKPTPLIANPLDAWNRMFPQGAGTGSGAPPASDPQLAAERARKRRVLDYVAKELTTVRPRLSQYERERLDSTAQLVADAQSRLQSTDGNAPQGQGCPGKTTVIHADSVANLDDAAAFNALYDAQATNIQLAFACDLTRVAMLSVSFPPGATFGYKPGDYDIQHEHDFCHKYESHGDKPKDRAAILLNGYRVYAQVFARLLEKLDAIKEADGTSVLDNTAVIWGGQIARGLHGLEGGRWLVAGSLGGRLNTGRYLVNQKNRSNADLFATVSSALGYGNFKGTPIPGANRA